MGNFLNAGTTAAEEDLELGDEEIQMTIPYIVLIIISMIILAPFAISMTYKYYRLRHSYMYNARRPMLVVAFNILATVFIAVYTPIHIIVFEIYWDNNATYEEWWDQALYFTTQVIVLVTFALRVWHSFYDFKLAHALSGLQWKSIINESYRDAKEDFFLKYHQTLGQPRKTFMRFLIIPSVIFTVVFLILIANKTGYESEYVMLFMAFMYLFGSVGILIYIISHTWRHVYDNIHLRGEILIGCIVICITIFLIVVIFGIDIYEYSVANEKYTQVFYFCWFCVTTAACFSLVLVSTQYVRIQVNKFKQRMVASDQRDRPKSGFTMQFKGNNGDDIDETVWITSDEIDFQALISTANGLVEFLDHLAKEYELSYLVVK